MSTLSVMLIEKAIDSACHESCKKPQQIKFTHGLVVSRIIDWNVVNEITVDDEDLLRSENYLSTKTPWHFGIQIQNSHPDTKTMGILCFYLAYSSWSGRILYFDRLMCQDFLNDEAEQLLLQILADIAISLDCARLTWRHTRTPEWHSQGSNQPETHDEVLTLSMNKEAMMTFVSDSPLKDAIPIGGSFSKDLVDTAFSKCLQAANSQLNSCFRLRLAEVKDLGTIVSLVKGLAEYVNEPDAIVATAEDYQKDGFDLDNPLWYCLLIDTVAENGSSSVTCGYAFIFIGYRLGGGRFVYLEDLYLQVEHRSGGGGSLTMKTLAALCLSLQCTNLFWQALDWNTSGLSFYNKIGATIHVGEKTSRYAGDALKRFAVQSQTM